MTSKEFLRRCDNYRYLSSALPYFTTEGPDTDYIYQCTIVDSSGKTVRSFCLTPSLSPIEGCYTIYFERFYRRDFVVQVRYFKTFVSRLSAIQLSKLSSDFSLYSLLVYADRK